jgi:uncharacterized protein (TIGR02996 family)
VTASASLYQAIVSAPDDRGLRAVYADALDEEGDARSEFVRLQLELERLGEDDPRRSEMEARVMRLLRTHGAGWLSPGTWMEWDWEGELFGNPDPGLPHFTPWLTGQDCWRYRGGLPEFLSAPAAEFLAHGERLRRFAPVRDLFLYQVYSPQAEEVRRARLARLRDLNAPPAIMESEERRLEEMRRWPRVGDIMRSQALRGLRALGFRVLQDDAVAELASSPALAGLQELHVGLSTHSTPAAFAALARSPALSGLEALALNGDTYAENSGTDVGDAACHELAGSGALARLKRLSLRDHRVGPGGLQVLLDSPRLMGLEELDLAGNRRLPPLLEILVAGEGLSRLRALDLADSSPEFHLRDGSQPDGQTWGRLANLVRLGLRGAEDLGDEGAAALAGTPALGNLRSLDLAGCGLGSEGALALLRSPSLGRLTTLRLDGNPFDVGVLRTLAGAPVCPRLRRLTLPRFAGPDEPFTRIGEVIDFLARAPLVNLVSLEFERAYTTHEYTDPPLKAEHARALVSSEHLRWLTYLGIPCTAEALEVLEGRWGPALYLSR